LAARPCCKQAVPLEASGAAAKCILPGQQLGGHLMPRQTLPVVVYREDAAWDVDLLPPAWCGQLGVAPSA
jgi:hypothetical protein